MTEARALTPRRAAWAPERIGDAEDMLDPIARNASPGEAHPLAARRDVEATLVPAVGEVIAVARSYEDLIDTCRTRRRELQLPQLVVDEIAGLQSGYTGKIECGSKRLGTMSMPCLLQALGLELVVVRTIPHHLRRAA